MLSPNQNNDIVTLPSVAEIHHFILVHLSLRRDLNNKLKQYVYGNLIAKIDRAAVMCTV